VTKVTLSGTQVSVPHAAMVSLRREGKLNLGIVNDVGEKLVSLGIRPAGGTSAAFWFYRLVALSVFVLGLYWAFTSAWWWGVLGLIAMTVIWNANRTGLSENLMDAAMDDPLFYERVRELNGWLYQIEEDAAEPFRTAKAA
jgi:hypothetical protein